MKCTRAYTLETNFNTGDKMKYTVDYFINKFEAIPEDNWITGGLYDPERGCCVLGFCGVTDYYDSNFTNESKQLAIVLGIHHPFYLYKINDNAEGAYQQPTPKQRILAALYDVKNKS